MYRHMHSILNVYCYEPNCRHTCGLFHVVNKTTQPQFMTSMKSVKDSNNISSKYKHMFNHNMQNDNDYRDKLGSLDIDSVDCENDQSKLNHQNSDIKDSKKSSVGSSTHVEWLANQEFLNELLSEDEGYDFTKYPTSTFLINNDDSDDELQELLRRVQTTNSTKGNNNTYNNSNYIKNMPVYEGELLDDDLDTNSLFSRGIYDIKGQEELLPNYEDNL
uniref:Zf-C3H1 domain-containing protein n=1 Tax=Strongyloides venezuelensis TaxID=75913 RepID=A0A0K0FIP4_STRVS